MPAPSLSLDPATVLDLVPTPNAAVHSERRGDELVLWVPLQRPWWTRGVVRWVLPIRDEKGFALDALGQEVWAACDGERTLERIIEGFAERHRLRFHEARIAVLQFLRSLVARKLVALVARKAEGVASAAEGMPS